MFHLLLHPPIANVTLRIIGAVDIGVMLIALAIYELSVGRARRQRLVRLSPVFIGGIMILVYVILISQGSIK